MKEIKIAIFASGTGSNAEHIIKFFQRHPFIKVGLLISNRKDAQALDKAEKLSVPTAYVPKSQFYDSNHVLTLLRRANISWIALAGFLLKVPPFILESYPDRIFNIHPSLLPKYGGKGMYGRHVHEAVVSNGEEETGITIHLVNEEYDKGRILSQISCSVSPYDTAEDVEKRVRVLELAHYPNVIAQEILRSLTMIY